MITPTEINAYLGVIEHQDQEKWSWSHVADKQYWRVKFSGALPACEINLELSGPYLCLQIDMRAVRVKPECREIFQFFLLRLNDDLPLVKFGLAENGGVELMAETMADQIGLNTFEELLRGVIAVFLQYRREIELLATDIELANLLSKPFETARGPTVSVVLVKPEPQNVNS